MRFVDIIPALQWTWNTWPACWIFFAYAVLQAMLIVLWLSNNNHFLLIAPFTSCTNECLLPTSKNLCHHVLSVVADIHQFVEIMCHGIDVFFFLLALCHLVLWLMTHETWSSLHLFSDLLTVSICFYACSSLMLIFIPIGLLFFFCMCECHFLPFCLGLRLWLCHGEFVVDGHVGSCIYHAWIGIGSQHTVVAKSPFKCLNWELSDPQTNVSTQIACFVAVLATSN